MLFYLPPYSPELNRIEVLWKHAKYHWRRFVAWTEETINAELQTLLGDYGSTFEIRFSRTLTSVFFTDADLSGYMETEVMVLAFLARNLNR